MGRLRRFRQEHELLRGDVLAASDDPFMLQLERAARALELDVADLERDVRTFSCWAIATTPTQPLRAQPA